MFPLGCNQFQEQLRHKQKFNLVAFDSRAYAWKAQLQEVNEKNLQSAWQWVKSLECKGSTNTLAALRLALADAATEAVYLLTDGRPDQVTYTLHVIANMRTMTALYHARVISH